MTILHLDYEGRSEIDLKKQGLDLYTSHESTMPLMAAYSFDEGKTQHWDHNYGKPPAELIEALEDPQVTKWAFNAQFERVFTRRVLKVKTDVRSWRCTMALAYMQSFSGGLDMVGKQISLPFDKLKMATGSKLINMFCKPQKISSKQPFYWRDTLTNPEEWDEFCDYNIQDNEAERAVRRRLLSFPIQQSEWDLYHLDQIINDRGFPIDRQFVRHAVEMSARRKAELLEQMRELTNLANPNSGAQLLPWLRERGYPFNDLQKFTVKKVLAENAEVAKHEHFEFDEDVILVPTAGGGFLDEEAVAGLKLRQQAARTSVTKLNAIENSIGLDGLLRFTLQFAGASRTSRWSGRRFQPQNLARPPMEFEPPKSTMKLGVPKDVHLVNVTQIIRDDDYDALCLYSEEPLNALAGMVRSAIKAPEGYELRVCDLSAIETRTTAAVAGCTRLLNVFANGKDPYIDFGQDLYSKPYEDVSHYERQCSKPAVLGCTYRLGGGDLRDGKRTGLWGYAEGMGVNLTKDESNRAVAVFRESYEEVPQTWYALENAAIKAIRTKLKVHPFFVLNGRRVNIPVVFEYMKPYLTALLPSGRRLYYYQPRVVTEQRTGRNGQPYNKDVISYMGQDQITKQWQRVETHGGKLIENLVQAIARDVLKEGLFAAARAGFHIIGHVHDEIITLQRITDTVHTVELLRDCMRRPLTWFPELLLDAAGYAAPFYRKD